ncbi:HEAT repeat domain-containing protein [Longimicrobium sp.]|uniref:HEAT repeat domain-containing protein n=1 Tax=Longimicrobium sp. TaxID=2029185 RepID=UPI002E336E3F|nr:HEAT repeat domain-containing protein [Longimicrobium sp.]
MARSALALAGLGVLGGCVFGGRDPVPRFGNALLVNEVVRILNVEEPSPAYYRERARLEGLGPQLDTVLTALVQNENADDHVRANAAVLLADRLVPGTVDLLRRQLTTSSSDVLRAQAVRVLQRFAADSAGAREALRAAVTDRSSIVRLNVLQRLDVEDAPLVRTLLAREGDAQVRTIARQLLEVLEARGAPLVRDARGDLRTSGREGAPQIVFHPTWADSAARLEVGGLWVELPNAQSLVPLAQDVEVVDEVVPAFFDPGRQIIVYESGREVRVRDLRSGGTRSLGPGVAPRVIPFTDHIVFVREVPGAQSTEAGGSVVDYDVLRASFSAGGPEPIGRLRAQVEPAIHRGASPVRWMVVGEARSGFVLRAPGFVEPFVLPGPFEAPPVSN